MDDPAPTSDEVEAYAHALFRHVRRRLQRRSEASPFDADDIAMEAVARFLVDASVVMRRYPEPRVYAAACTASRTEDWRRRERAQRSEGARLVRKADGAFAVARPLAALSAMAVANVPIEPGGYDEVDFLADLHAALLCLDPRDRVLVVNVELLGYSITEAAVLSGLSRAHASRRHTRALVRLRELAGVPTSEQTEPRARPAMLDDACPIPPAQDQLPSAPLLADAAPLPEPAFVWFAHRDDERPYAAAS